MITAGQLPAKLYYFNTSMKNNRIRVVQIGLGPLGRQIARHIAEKKGIVTADAADIAPELTGKDLGELAGLGANGVTVCPNTAEMMRRTQADAAVLTTVSSLEAAAPHIEEILSFGLPVVSTCEELSYPWKTRPDLARRIDETAKRHGAAVLGTGVNPGFLMDALAVFLSAVCLRVDAIKVSRIQDAAQRRVPFQEKIGAGLTKEEFEKKAEAKIIRHVGLTESLWMIASRMGWELDKTDDTVTPVIAEKEIHGAAKPIPAGCVAGVEQTGRGFIGGEEKITLLFRAAIGQPNPCDKVELQGEPPLTFTIPGGVHGDKATCAITINAIPQIMQARPGLRAMADMPPLGCFNVK